MVRGARVTAIAGMAAVFFSAAHAAAAPTYVSLTFDDTLGDQYDTVRSLLLAHGVHATFYVNSGRIDGTDYMTRDQLATLEQDGNELGGHTVNHVPLVGLPEDEQRRQICDDRANLLGLGFRITNFAYPLAQDDPTIQSIVQACGYVTARAVGGLACAGCSTGESIPPEAALHLRTPPSIIPTTTLADLEGYVTTAEDGGGGWVPLVFHHTCDGCNPLSVTPTTLDSFLTWLEKRSSQETKVKTVAEIVGGDVKPAVTVPLKPAGAIGDNVAPNSSFEDDADGVGIPDCWRLGKSSAALQPTSDAHSGGRAVTLEMQATDTGAPRLITVQDMGACAPTAVPHHVYAIGAYTKATSAPRFVAYLRTELGGWRYWSRSPQLAVSSSYALQTWQTPELPDGATGLSIGIELETPGSVTVDDFSLADTGEASSSGCSIARSESPAATDWLVAGLALGLVLRRRRTFAPRV